MTSLEIINRDLENLKKEKEKIYNLGKDVEFDIDDHIEDLDMLDCAIQELEQMKNELELFEIIKPNLRLYSGCQLKDCYLTMLSVKSYESQSTWDKVKKLSTELSIEVIEH